MGREIQIPAAIIVTPNVATPVSIRRVRELATGDRRLAAGDEAVSSRAERGILIVPAQPLSGT